MPDSAPSAVTAAPAPPATTGSRKKNARTSTSSQRLGVRPERLAARAGPAPAQPHQAAAASADEQQRGRDRRERCRPPGLGHVEPAQAQQNPQQGGRGARAKGGVWHRPAEASTRGVKPLAVPRESVG